MKTQLYKTYSFINKILLFLFVAGIVSAKTPYIEVQSMVDTSEIYIGDLITYSLIIKRDKNLRIERPGEGLNLGQFEIKNYKFSDPQEENGIVTERFDFTISVFDTGSYTIPPFPVAYFPDSSDQYKIIEAAPIDIRVNSILSGDEAPQLKDIKPVIDLPFDYVFLYSMIGVVLLVGLAALLGYRAWKQKKEKGYLFTPPPKPRPAHEIALEELKKLYQSDLLEKKEFKNFYIRLSEILRIYLEGRYFISALEETTYEILLDMKKHVNENEFNVLQEILSEADLVKFAKHLPEQEMTEQIKQKCEQFIHDTKIILKPESKLQDATADQEQTVEAVEESEIK